MNAFIAEIIGTAVLLLLGNGVVANVVLNKTKGNGSGWIVITFGWSIAVFTAVFISASASGAHLNPAVTLGLAMIGKFAWSQVGSYLLAQMIGAAIGTSLVWLMYRPHFESTSDPDAVLASFCTSPAIKNTFSNVASEALGTFILVYGVFHIAGATVGDAPASLGSLDALPVALVVLGVGLCLGGTTGYAINPARDLGPRIMHSILPISTKGPSNWGYAWLPVAGPILGAALAALVFMNLG